MSFLHNLEWRHACKAFDPKEKVSQDHLDKIKEAIRLAPTSFGLQPFYVKVVKDQERMAKVRQLGWNQPQFTTATELLFFVGRSDVRQVAKEMLEDRSGGKDPMKVDGLKDFAGMVYGWIDSIKDPGFFENWVQRQIYIALGFGLAACAELKVDSCPMEGFDHGAVGKLLELGEGEATKVVLAVGKKDPAVSVFPKWRFKKELIIRK